MAYLQFFSNLEVGALNSLPMAFWRSQVNFLGAKIMLMCGGTNEHFSKKLNNLERLKNA
jgi:hypothetical protein